MKYLRASGKRHRLVLDRVVSYPACSQHLDRLGQLASRRDTRTKEQIATWFMRVMIGIMFYQGSIWKVPFPVNGSFEASVRSIAENAAFAFHREIAKNLFIPLLPVLDPVTYFTELFLAISFIVGFLVRPMSVVGMLFVAQLWLGLYHQSEEWPWLYVFLIFVQGFFFVTSGGKSLGLDGLIARSETGRFMGTGFLARLYRAIA
jgi:uncharacterized membrane protein YphA (DoxX/SURF4 family)